MAEEDRSRVSAVFAADSELDVRSCLASVLRCQSDKFSNACLIKSLERVGLDDSSCDLFFDEVSGIISGETKSHLCQIVGSE